MQHLYSLYTRLSAPLHDVILIVQAQSSNYYSRLYTKTWKVWVIVVLHVHLHLLLRKIKTHKSLKATLILIRQYKTGANIADWKENRFRFTPLMLFCAIFACSLLEMEGCRENYVHGLCCLIKVSALFVFASEQPFACFDFETVQAGI